MFFFFFLVFFGFWRFFWRGVCSLATQKSQISQYDTYIYIAILEWSLSPMNMSILIIFSKMNAVKLLFKTMDQKTIQVSSITIIALLNFLSMMMSRYQRTIMLNRIHIRRLYCIANILQHDNILNSKALFFAQIKVNQEIMTNL